MNHITLAVSNLEKSFSFYQKVLELRPLVRWSEGAYFLTRENTFWFCLNVDKARKATSCCTHYAFSATETDFPRISENIKLYGAPLYQENTSPGNSLYFLDPDGHKLEIHTGNWKSRLTSKKLSPDSWKHVEWFL